MRDGADLDGQLVNPACSTATLLIDNESQQMAERAAAVPAGLSGSGDLDWRDGREHQIEITQRWSSWASDHDLDVATVVRLGCVWSFGARHRGRGRYLADAYLYAVVDSAGVGQRFSATGWFAAAPVEVGRIAALAASVELSREQFLSPAGTSCFALWIQGDGAGSIEEA